MTGHLTYRPGPWTCVAGPAGLIAVERVVTSVEPLWRAVRTADDLEDLLDVVTAGGLRALPGFVVVTRATGSAATSVVLRGQVAVDVVDGGTARELRGDRVRSWAEHCVEAVLGMRFGGVVDDLDRAPALPLSSGAVMAASVQWDVAAPVGAGQPRTEDAQAAPSDAPGEQPPDDVPRRGPVADETLLGEPDRDYDHLFGPTVDHSASASDVPATAPQGDTDHDQLTVHGAALAELLAGSAPPSATDPGPPGLVSSVPGGRPPSGRRASTGVAPTDLELVFSTGAVVPLTGRVVVGREPTATRFSGGEFPRLVPVPSPSSDISRNHLEVRQEDGAAVAVDLGSTNGTVVTDEHGRASVVADQGRAVLVPGTVLDLGDGVTISVRRADGAR